MSETSRLTSQILQAVSATRGRILMPVTWGRSVIWRSRRTGSAFKFSMPQMTQSRSGKRRRSSWQRTILKPRLRAKWESMRRRLVIARSERFWDSRMCMIGRSTLRIRLWDSHVEVKDFISNAQCQCACSLRVQQLDQFKNSEWPGSVDMIPSFYINTSPNIPVFPSDFRRLCAV